jgi:hypothetical protein
MTLQEAYQGWQAETANKQLYIKSRDAFRKTWLMLPTNKECSYYTLEVLSAAIVQTKMMHSFRIQASSVMVHVLTWAHRKDAEANPMPAFTFSQIVEDGEALEKKAREAGERKPEESVDTVCLREKMAMTELEPARIDHYLVKDVELDEDGRPLPVTVGKDGRPLPVTKETKTNNDTTMNEEKKSFGTAPKPVCQIDPETLKVVRTFESCSAACKSAGVKSIDYALKNLSKSGGYYWQFPDQMDTFLDRLEKKGVIATATVSTPQAVTAPKPKEETPKPSFDEAQGSPEPEGGRPSTKERPGATDQQIKNLLEHCRQEEAQQRLAAFQDKELIDELGRRGWKGKLELILSVTIGGSGT